MAETDYSTSCESTPLTFVQMIAATIVTYNGHNRINTISITDYCTNLTSFWTCNNNGIDPERALVENVFALDDCGRLAVKIFNNQGAGRGGEQ